MIKRTTTLFFLLIAFPSFAQLGGESTYQFLNLVSSPRQAALGGKIITNFDYDVSESLYNPASINSDQHNQLALNYSSYLGGIGYGTASYAYTWDRHVQTFHFGITYINYGDFDGFDLNGVSTGSFSGNEVAISAAYNYNIPFTDFYIGGRLKIITSQLEQFNSVGGALDFGFMYVNEDIDFNAAITVRNLGTQFTTYAGENEPIPFEVNFGLSQTLEYIPLRWHLTLDNLQKWPIGRPNPARVTTDLSGNQTKENVGFFNNALRHLILGAELWPDKGFNLRFGYNFRRAEELRIVDQRNFSGLSFGLGMKINKLRFSYTHARYTGAANTSFVGLQIDLQ
ncbi:type IX secretion system protein PorQ [Winogradskyella immobilis]|uniref:Type IX secretion system protein PorQ n=1 Tax=Winogradskyella immobilis TaxID=2816852 RepID=A0ABS8EKI8_9FLAO|nr:type IX secretion system protein PorQ [Winogradskyella immobilis]MCC1483743.1 type IX secretion system protein PorQ [Winogradskyella immobilis]MCG0015837.1 type IX secretion system protein PorQ [Winogradskyella immobilis]